ncbi:VMAP-C domain-containing protein, partial [Streptomyces antimycoticus]
MDAYLVIRLLPQEEAGCYDLSSWHQYDPSGWHPARGPVTQVTLETAERAVQTLVYEAAEEWDDAGAIHIEFMLDSDDLNLPVHRWRLELDSESPIPLCMGRTGVGGGHARTRTGGHRRLPPARPAGHGDAP